MLMKTKASATTCTQTLGSKLRTEIRFIASILFGAFELMYLCQFAMMHMGPSCSTGRAAEVGLYGGMVQCSPDHTSIPDSRILTMATFGLSGFLFLEENDWNLYDVSFVLLMFLSHQIRNLCRPDACGALGFSARCNLLYVDGLVRRYHICVGEFPGKKTWQTLGLLPPVVRRVWDCRPCAKEIVFGFHFEIGGEIHWCEPEDFECWYMIHWLASMARQFSTSGKNLDMLLAWVLHIADVLFWQNSSYVWIMRVCCVG